MVYPVYDLEFKIGTKGITSVALDMKTIIDMETFELTIDGEIVEWNPMDQKGWVRRLMTAKSISFSLSGKRNYGDPGNDYVANLFMANGNDANSKMELAWPDESKLEMNCVVKVTANGAGASTDVGTLECELLSDGKPVFTEAT